MKLQNTLLMAAFGLIMSALSVQTAHAQAVTTQAAKSASIKISALPFNITAPGTYVLTGNLTFNPVVDNAITITAGSVILDLKGYTISNIGNDSVGVAIATNATTNNISIRNGTITNFEQGVAVVPQSGPLVFISNINVHQMTFSTKFGSSGIGVHLVFTSLSTISNCRFISCGIEDSFSQGGIVIIITALSIAHC